MQCFLGKRLDGKFMRDVSKVADARSWQWLRAGYLGKGTEAYVFAAQEQALRRRFFSATIEREDVDPKCRVCCKEVESVGHVASGCSGLVQREYRRRHDHMGLRVYWELYRKYGIKSANVWYKEVQMRLECLRMGRLRSGGIGVSKQHGNWNIIIQTLPCWIRWLGGGLC